MIFEPPSTTPLDDLDAELVRAFDVFRQRLAQEEPVLVVVDDEALDGSRGPVEAALAFGLLGLVRALAVEGQRDGWQISMLAAPRSAENAERAQWIELLRKHPASGSLLRLGSGQLGHLPA